MKLLNVPDIRSPGKITNRNYLNKNLETKFLIEDKLGLWSKGQSFSEKIKLKKYIPKKYIPNNNIYEKDIYSIV